MTSAHGDRLDEWRKKSNWSFLASALCGILTVIDYDRYASRGWIIIGRESQVLTGWGAQLVIGAFLAGTLGFFAYGVHLRRRMQRRR